MSASATPTSRDANELVTLWRRMVLLRAVDERATSLQRQGRMGAYPIFWGEEGIQAAAVTAVRPTDWLFLSYRQNAVPVLRGLPPERVFLYFRGDPQSFFDPFEYGCSPQAVPVATQLPHAVGWAWGRKLDGHDDVAVAFFGDGATSEGDFHEAMNIAGVRKAPVVFLCTNNQWAISTPVSRQTAVDRLADKAAAYGMPGERVDGFDAPAVLHAVRQAAERARAGEGPSLIEAFCYRIGPHATADDPSLYRDHAESDRWREREPVAGLRDQLVADGRLTEKEAEHILAETHQALAEAAERLDNTPPADRDYLVRSIFASPPPGYTDQVQELQP